MPKNTRIMNLKYLPMHSLKIKNHIFRFSFCHSMYLRERERERESSLSLSLNIYPL